MNKITRIVITGLFLLVITGCGEESKWGIDGEEVQNIEANSVQNIPLCNIGSLDAIKAGAIRLSSGSVVQKIGEKTKLRIWHFENTSKAICVLEGQAIIEEKTKDSHENT